MWHWNINCIKLTHLASFPHIAWKEKRGTAWKGKIKSPSEAALPSMNLFPGWKHRQSPGHCRGQCLGIGEAACPPFFPAAFSHLPPQSIPHVCHPVAAPTMAHCIRPWGITFTVWDTWDLSNVVTQSPQPAWGIPCSNIFLELSYVYRLIRNTRIPSKQKVVGILWFVLLYIRSSCYFLCRFFLKWILNEGITVIVYKKKV